MPISNQASDSDEVVVPAAGVVSVTSVPESVPSSIFGTIKLSLDIKLYFITKQVNRLQRWDLVSKSSNKLL